MFPVFFATMAYDHFRPPEHFSPRGRFLFRALCWVTFIVGMLAFSYFVVPIIAQYVSQPFSEWVGNTIFGPKDAASPR